MTDRAPAKVKIRTQAAAFYKTRMQDTLTHTQRSTGQIYLVNGAVLAMLYFVAGAENVDRDAKVAVVTIGLLTLAAVNTIHAQIMTVQHRWYVTFADLHAKAVQAENPRHELPDKPTWPIRAIQAVLRGGRPEHGAWFNSTHRCYRAIHQLLAVVLIVLAGLAVAYRNSLFEPKADRKELHDQLARELGDELRARVRDDVLADLRRITPPVPPK